jgi:methylated-DNA-protein-cysteine methyltransferase-like protein
MSSTWQQQVWGAVRLVPRGRVTSYGDVAAFVGHPRRARQVGGALGALGGRDADLAVPWHRVVNARGFLSIRGAHVGKDAQRSLLRSESVDVDEAYVVVDFDRLRWRFVIASGP